MPTNQTAEKHPPPPEDRPVSAHHQAIPGEVENPFERRVAPRVAARLEVELRLSEGPSALMARSCDIGAGGMCVETQGPFALTSLREISIRLPDGSMTLQAKGCSQRIDSFGVGHFTGVEFVDPDPAKRQRLWEVVHRQSVQLSRFLDESPDLGDLDLDEALELARATRLRAVPCGRRLYGEETWRPGEDSVFVVVRGTVAIDARSHRARDVWLERVEPGGLFGGLPLVAKMPHVESATAEADLELLEIDRFTFRYLEWTKPQIARAIGCGVMRKQARHLSDLIRRMAEAA